MTDTRRPKGPAPPDPGIIPGGIRDRAMRAVLARGPTYEDREATKRSQEFWQAFHEGRKLLARAEQVGAWLGCSPAIEAVIKQTKLPVPHLAIVTTKISDPHRLQPFETFLLDDTTGEVSNIVCFASIAAALIHHDRMARAAREKAAE